MKAKNALNQQIVITGYAVEVAKQDGYMSLRMDYEQGVDYRVPDDYVGITFHDDEGNECYAFVPRDMRVGGPQGKE